MTGPHKRWFQRFTKSFVGCRVRVVLREAGVTNVALCPLFGALNPAERRLLLLESKILRSFSGPDLAASTQAYSLLKISS